jgi:hypothetical protein
MGNFIFPQFRGLGATENAKIIAQQNQFGFIRECEYKKTNKQIIFFLSNFLQICRTNGSSCYRV